MQHATRQNDETLLEAELQSLIRELIEKCPDAYQRIRRVIDEETAALVDKKSSLAS